MTKEELWIEADKYVTTTGNNDCTIDAYIAGAKPREKRIAELEKENAELKQENIRQYENLEMRKMQNDDATKIIKEMQLKIDDLQKENAELKETVEHYRKERAFFISEVEK